MQLLGKTYLAVGVLSRGGKNTWPKSGKHVNQVLSAKELIFRTRAEKLISRTSEEKLILRTSEEKLILRTSAKKNSLFLEGTFYIVSKTSFRSMNLVKPVLFSPLKLDTLFSFFF